MSKGKFVASLAVAAFVVWSLVGSANSGIVDPNNSTASAAAGAILVCPQGDGTALSDVGATISVTVKDNTNTPIEGILASSFWLIGASNGLNLCGGSGSSNADSATNVNGQTTISGAVAAGGCDTGLRVVVSGTVINTVLPIEATSPDMNSDLLVDILDFGLFGPNFGKSEAGGADPCADFAPDVRDNNIDILDFARFGTHWLHQC